METPRRRTFILLLRLFTSLKILILLPLLGTHLSVLANLQSSKQTLDSHPEKFSHHPSLLSQHNCFSGNLASYDKWQNFITNKRKMPIEKFQRIFPRSDYEKYKANLSCYFFTYDSSGYEVRGIAILPKDQADSLESTNSASKNKVVIFNRGGNKSRKHTLNFSSLFRYHFPLAEQGYIVISSQYRGAEVWRNYDPERHGKDEFGGRDVEDVINLAPIIKGIPSAQSDSLAMFGWSRGAMMSLLAAKQMPNIDSLILGGAPVDLLAQTSQRPQLEKYVFARLIPNYQTEKETALIQRSALYWPEQIPKQLPILMLHGTLDKRTDITPVRKFAKALKQQGQMIKLVEYDDGHHGLTKHLATTQQQVFNWLEQTLP